VRLIVRGVHTISACSGSAHTVRIDVEGKDSDVLVRVAVIQKVNDVLFRAVSEHRPRLYGQTLVSSLGVIEERATQLDLVFSQAKPAFEDTFESAFLLVGGPV